MPAVVDPHSGKPANGQALDATVVRERINALMNVINALDAENLASNAVTEAKIASGAVTATKIGAGAVEEAKIATDAVTTAKIADANVTEAKLASNAVTTAKIAASAVTSAKVDATVTTLSFKDVAVVDSSGVAKANSPVVADSAADTLTLKEGAGISMTVDATTDTVTIAATGGGTTPAARAFHNTSVSVANSTTVVVPFNSERFDNDAIHDTAVNNSRLTCQTAGRYLIVANVEWDIAPSAAGSRILAIRLNGSTVIGRVISLGWAGFLAQNVQTVYDLAVNDYVEVTVLHDQGTTLSLRAAGNYSPEFMMVKVG